MGPIYNVLISIIIPTFNRGPLLSETIESVINQTYDYWELLVVDDGSEDNTPETVFRYADSDNRIRFVKRPSERPKGANTCRNIGLEQSKGEFIKWLDSDDLLDRSCLQRQLEAILKDSADVCFCQSRNFATIAGKIVLQDALWSKRLSTENLVESLVTGKLRWATLSGLWRKDYLQDKPFVEGLMNSQEWLFHIQASLRDTRFCFLEQVLCYVRFHTASMSNKSLKGGNYYYHTCYSRVLAIHSLGLYKPQKYRSMIAFLLKKYFRFHIFTLYKGGIREFIQLFLFYPGMVSSLIK